jgi:hypothetical protein
MRVRRLAAALAFVLFAVTGGIVFATPGLASDDLQIEVFPSGNLQDNINAALFSPGGYCYPLTGRSRAVCKNSGMLVVRRPRTNMKSACDVTITRLQTADFYKHRWDAHTKNTSGSCQLSWVDHSRLEVTVR